MHFPVFGQERCEIKKVKKSVHGCVQVGLKVHVCNWWEVICGSKTLEGDSKTTLGILNNCGWGVAIVRI